MIRKNGGYLIIDLTSTDLVEELEKAYTDDKPTLVYDTNGKANWFTLTKVDTDYYLTGANAKYKITSAGVITSESVIPSLYEHRLKLTTTGTNAITLFCSILSDISDAITKTNLYEILKGKKPLSASGTLIASNISQGGYLYYQIDAFAMESAGTNIHLYCHRFNANSTTSAFESFESVDFDYISINNATIKDNVIKLI